MNCRDFGGEGDPDLRHLLPQLPLQSGALFRGGKWRQRDDTTEVNN